MEQQVETQVRMVSSQNRVGHTQFCFAHNSPESLHLFQSDLHLLPLLTYLKTGAETKLDFETKRQNMAIFKEKRVVFSTTNFYTFLLPWTMKQQKIMQT